MAVPKMCGNPSCGHAHSDSFDGEGKAIAKACGRCDCGTFVVKAKAKS